jgi:histidinol-phosphate aminotransferase
MTSLGFPPETPPRRPTPKAGILDIAPYVGGKSKAAGFAHPVKLSSNENVLGCSPKAREAFLAGADRLSLYPDGKSNNLRAAVAGKFGLEPERLVFGCGSDEVFSLLCQVYLESGDNMVQGEYGFLAYRIAARAAGGEVRFAPEPNLRLDVDQLLAQVDERTKLVFLANPANPTGAWLVAEEVRRLHAGLPAHTILVLDGAYAEFADDPNFTDGLELARGAENVVVTHTFSKIHGLAALRVGWGYAPAAIVDALERIRLPFNLSIPGQEAAIAALNDDAFVARSRELVNTWRPWLAQQLGGIGLEVLPSQANFVAVLFPREPGRTAHDAEAFLAGRGYIVRGLASYNLGEALRITIGLESQNRAVVDLLAEFLGQAR